MSFEWSPQQAEGIKAMNDWYGAANQQIFRLFGYAGTGKSTLANELAKSAAGSVLYMAYTGKAAVVMQKAGCRGASTIHSGVYKTKVDPVTGKAVFHLNKSGPASMASLIVIDECSMVDKDLAADLMSFGKPILALGDPFQLPPVKSAGFFTHKQDGQNTVPLDPDHMLTEIHRQAAGNPIIKLATDVRMGRPLVKGHYGESCVIDSAEVDRQDVINADQVLVGLNRTRGAYNGRLRELLGRKTDDKLPIKEDRLVCLKNNHDIGIFNGGLFTVVGTRRSDITTCIKLIVKSEDFPDRDPVEVDVRREFFNGNPKDIHWKELYGTDQFDYGYALTVHKSQGSQWDWVYLFDESATFRESADRWLYTGITRAANRITIVQ